MNMLRGTNIENIPNIARGFTIADTILKNVSGIESPKYKKNNDKRQYKP